MASPIAGSLRFRLLDNAGHPPDASRWSEGADLLCPDGTVWEKPLLTIVKSRPQLSALQALLLKDGLISPDVVDRCLEILKWRNTLGPNILLSYLDKVFWTPFSSMDRGQFAVAGRTAQRYVKIAPFFRDMRSRKTLTPYTGKSFLFLFALAEPDDSPQGSALCKFELYDPSITRTRRSTIQKLEAQGLPRRQIVLRILKIEDPASCVIPDYDGWVHEPKAGDLLRIGRHGVPWSYDVDTREMRPMIGERLGLTQERMREDMDGLKLLLDDH